MRTMPQPEEVADPMPPASRALLRRLNAWAQRVQAQYPEHAEAIRRRKARQVAATEEAA